MNDQQDRIVFQAIDAHTLQMHRNKTKLKKETVQIKKDLNNVSLFSLNINLILQ